MPYNVLFKGEEVMGQDPELQPIKNQYRYPAMAPVIPPAIKSHSFLNNVIIFSFISMSLLFVVIFTRNNFYRKICCKYRHIFY